MKLYYHVHTLHGSVLKKLLYMLLIFKSKVSGSSMTMSRVPKTKLYHELEHHLHSAETLRKQRWKKEGGCHGVVAAVPEDEAQV